MIRRMKIGVWLVATVLLVSTLVGCHRAPDAARVRAAIADTATAAQAADASGTVASLSGDFDGNDGALQRRDLANLVRLIKLRDEHVGVTMGPVAVERRGNRLLANFTVTLTSGGRWLPNQLGVYQVQSAWRQENGDWRCYTAAWSRSL